MKPINRSTKKRIVFDEKARADYLTGFRKRKAERRKKALEQLEKSLKEDIKLAKEKARNRLLKSKASSSNHIVPEIEHLLPTAVHDLGSHTVSVTTIDDLSALDKLKESGAPDPDGLDRAEKKNLGKAVSKSLTESKKFQRASQQIKKLSNGGKGSKSNAKKQRKRMKSKRERHFHPKRTVSGSKS